VVGVGRASGFLPELAFDFAPPVIALPLVAVVLTTWLASWIGSRRVLAVSPMQATGASQEESLEQASGHRARNVTAAVLMIAGLAALALSVLVGLVTPAAVLVGVVGGLLSFSGFVLGAHLGWSDARSGRARPRGSRRRTQCATRNAARAPRSAS
jgi:putative ABC transport system permease protein